MRPTRVSAAAALLLTLISMTACSSSTPDAESPPASSAASSPTTSDPTPVWDEESLKLISFEVGESVPVGFVATDSFEPSVRTVDDARASMTNAGLPSSGCGMSVYYQPAVLDELTGVWIGRELTRQSGDQLGAVGELTESADVAAGVYETIAGGFESCDETPPPFNDITLSTYEANPLDIDCGNFECTSSRLDIAGEDSSEATFYSSTWYSTILSGNLVLTLALQSEGSATLPVETDADFQQFVSAHTAKLDAALRFVTP